MAGNSLSSATINQALYSQAIEIAAFYTAAKQHLIEWEVNLPDAASMTAAGFADTNDQAQLTQHIADLAALVAHFEGTESAANTRSLINDLAALKKVS